MRHYKRFGQRRKKKLAEDTKKVRIHRSQLELHSQPLQEQRERVGKTSGRRAKSTAATVRLLSPSNEAALVSYVGDVSTCGYEYSRKQLGALVTETAFFMKVTSENDTVSDIWMQHFLARWPELDITEMDSVPLAKLRSNTTEAVDNYYRELMRLMQKYDVLDKPDRIFRVHDTVVDTDQRGGKAAEANPEASLYSRATPSQYTEATIISCMNAAGHVLPPYIVFSGRRMARDLLMEGLPGTGGVVSNNGMANSRNFQRFLKDHFLSIVPCSRDNPVLVLYDGHRPFVNMPIIDWAEQQFIVLYLLPPHATSAQQPKEDSAFQPFKAAYQRKCEEFLVDNVGRIVTRYDVCDLAGKAYRQVMTQEVIVPSFRDMGVVPYDPTVVSNEYPEDNSETTDRSNGQQSEDAKYIFVDIPVEAEQVALKTEPL